VNRKSAIKVVAQILEEKLGHNGAMREARLSDELDSPVAQKVMLDTIGDVVIGHAIPEVSRELESHGMMIFPATDATGQKVAATPKEGHALVWVDNISDPRWQQWLAVRDKYEAACDPEIAEAYDALTRIHEHHKPHKKQRKR